MMPCANLIVVSDIVSHSISNLLEVPGTIAVREKKGREDINDPERVLTINEKDCINCSKRLCYKVFLKLSMVEA